MAESFRGPYGPLLRGIKFVTLADVQDADNNAIDYVDDAGRSFIAIRLETDLGNGRAGSGRA